MFPQEPDPKGGTWRAIQPTCRIQLILPFDRPRELDHRRNEEMAKQGRLQNEHTGQSLTVYREILWPAAQQREKNLLLESRQTSEHLEHEDTVTWY